MTTEKKTNGEMRHGPYKTHLTLSTALAMMTMPVVVVVGEYRWIVADSNPKHIEALCRLWRMADDGSKEHLPAWIESIPKETVDYFYDRSKAS